MNDYIQQLKEYKEKTWKATRTAWSESDVRTLLETGKCEGHSEKSCSCMISKLRSDRDIRNRFCGLVHEFGDKLKIDKIGRLNQKLDKEEIDLITRHVVPYGRAKQSCAAYMSNNKLNDSSTARQPWAYESKKEYEARTGKVVPVQEKAQEVIPTFAETVEKHEVKTSELDLNLQAVKALMGAGMSFQQIAKVTGKEENLVIALMKVCEAFN